MSSTPPTTRRLAIAMTAAIASTTIAIGATAASLLGWLRPPRAPTTEVAPTAPATTPSPVIYVPITPSAPPPPAPLRVEDPTGPSVQLAMDDHHDDESEREHDEDDEGDDD